MAQKDTNDELLRKLRTNFRKSCNSQGYTPVKEKSRKNGKENTRTRKSVTDDDQVADKTKSVKFSSTTLETSVGGTFALGKIQELDSSIESNGVKVKTGVSNKTTASLNDSDSDNSEVKLNKIMDIFERPRDPLTPSSTNNFRTPRRNTTGAFGTPDCFNKVLMGTPMRTKHQWQSGLLMSDLEEDDSSVTVAVRVKPFSNRDLSLEDVKCVVSMLDNETVITSDSGLTHRFTYDYSFWSFDTIGGQYADQEFVYQTLAQPLLVKAFEGYNVCLFAYGQTGSGKSYSIMGEGDDHGIIPRFSEELFQRMISLSDEKNKINVEISFFEIYNEKIHDLLAPNSKDKSGKKATLKVREHPLLGPFVEGLTSYGVNNFADVKGWLNVGNKHRATASTGMNDKSSRSHSVFTMVLTQTRIEELEGEKHEHSVISKIHLVDLAGSERQSQAQTSGERLREGASINKSLLTLGKVISLLADRSKVKKKQFIPYRDSVLTWLLKDSIGGNSKTSMLATINPSNHHTDETLSTLRYAKQARDIINSARVNEDPKAKVIRELRAEIEKLRGQMGPVSDDVFQSSLAEIVSLKDQLKRKEEEMQELTRSWAEHLKKSEAKKKEQSAMLEQSGISFKVDNKMPNLVNLNEDPQLTEMLLYVLKEGQTQVGRQQQGSKHDIQLNGPLIAENHCTIKYVDGKASIAPAPDAPTYINGVAIVKPTVIHHGDRVILGGDHYFRFNHPLEVKKGRKSSCPGQTKDFDFAKKELIKVQNEKLQAELEATKKRHASELESELNRKQQEKMDELKLQRSQYEQKLAELSKNLENQKQIKDKSEQDRIHAQDMLNKISQQKAMLERDILGNIGKDNERHSRFMEEMEKEQQRLEKEMIRLKSLQQKKREACLTPRSSSNSISKGDLYRIALQLREANKIAQWLDRGVKFLRQDVTEEGNTATVVKVLNSELKIATFWSYSKFGNRLLQLREIFQQGDKSSSKEEVDDIFNDPEDIWEKEDRLIEISHLSPKMVKANSRRTSIRLSFSSGSGSSPVLSARKTPRNTGMAIENGDDDKNRLSNISEGSGKSSLFGNTQVAGVCKDIISISLQRCSDKTLQESIADKVLLHSELLKTSITNQLENPPKLSGSRKENGSYLENEVTQAHTIQMASSFQSLLDLSEIWINRHKDLTTGFIHSLCLKLTSTIKKIGADLVHFLQGSEDDIDSLVQQASSDVLQGLLELCRLAGELAIASDTKVSLVLDPDADDSQDDVDEDDDVFIKQVKPRKEVCQAFMSGCHSFIEKTIQGGIKTVEGAEVQILDIQDDDKLIQNYSLLASEVGMITASCKIMLQNLQQMQCYLNLNYADLQETVTQISHLTDGATFIVQSASPLLKGEENYNLKRLYRCAELVLKSMHKLLASLSSPDADSDSDKKQMDNLKDDISSACGSVQVIVKKIIVESKSNSTNKS